MTVSRELKAKRLASVSVEQSFNIEQQEGGNDKKLAYEESFLYYYNLEELDQFHDNLHHEITDEYLKSFPSTALEFTNIHYNFNEGAYVKKHEDDPYHHVTQRQNATLEGEIFAGEIDFGRCWATPTLKYTKNMITGEYDFSRTETELLGYDCITSALTSVSFTEKALPLLFEIMLKVVTEGTDKMLEQYKLSKEPRPIHPPHLDDDTIPF